MSVSLVPGLVAIGLFLAGALFRRDGRLSILLIAGGIIGLSAQLLANHLPWGELEVPAVALVFAAGAGIGGVLSQFYPSANGKA